MVLSCIKNAIIGPVPNTLIVQLINIESNQRFVDDILLPNESSFGGLKTAELLLNTKNNINHNRFGKVIS